MTKSENQEMLIIDLRGFGQWKFSRTLELIIYEAEGEMQVWMPDLDIRTEAKTLEEALGLLVYRMGALYARSVTDGEPKTPIMAEQDRRFRELVTFVG